MGVERLEGSYRATESIGSFRVCGVAATTGAKEIILADTSTSIPVGIIQDSASTGTAANLVTYGQTRASCGASVSAGSRLTWQTATGQVIEATVNTSSSQDATVGFALESGSTNATIQIQFIPNLIDYV